MTPDGKDVYRWRYSVNLYKNFGLLWLFYKVFGGIFAGCLLFVLFLGDFKVSPEGAKWTSVGFAVMIAIVTLSYYIYALIQHGRYTWDFEMDEKGVKHKVHARQLKRAKVVAVLAALMGLLARKPAIISAGILAGSRASLYSTFASVKKITAVKARNVIYLDARLNHNQIYVDDEDFDEVYDFIAARCVNAKGRGRRKTRKG